MQERRWIEPRAVRRLRSYVPALAGVNVRPRHTPAAQALKLIHGFWLANLVRPVIPKQRSEVGGPSIIDQRGHARFFLF